VPGLHRAVPAWQYKSLCESTKHENDKPKSVKHCALSCRLKLEMGSVDLRDSGREFQTVGPAIPNALLELCSRSWNNVVGGVGRAQTVPTGVPTRRRSAYYPTSSSSFSRPEC